MPPLPAYTPPWTHEVEVPNRGLCKTCSRGPRKLNRAGKCVTCVRHEKEA